MATITKPLVSVIVPAYNAGEWLVETLESVLRQTYDSFEVIVVDDCSTDNTADIVREFTKLDSRFRLIQHTINLGNASACNTAIENAKGKYIALLGSDDLWELSKLEKQVLVLETTGNRICITHAKCFGENDLGKEQLFNTFSYSPNNRGDIIRRFFYTGNFICDSSAMVDKELYNELGLYNPRFQVLVDWDFWVRAIIKHNIFIINEKLTKIRIRKDSSSYTRLDTIVQCNYEHLKILNHFLNISIDDFYKFIPNAEQSHGKQTDIRLLPTMLASEMIIKGTMAAQVQWGLDVLYNELGKIPKEIYETFDFTYKSFHGMTRKMDLYRVSIASELQEMKEKQERYERQIPNG